MRSSDDSRRYVFPVWSSWSGAEHFPLSSLPRLPPICSRLSLHLQLSVAPWIPWQRAVIGHTVPALSLFPLQWLAVELHRQSGLINLQASGGTSSLQLRFCSMTSPPPRDALQNSIPPLAACSCLNVHCFHVFCKAFI